MGPVVATNLDDANAYPWGHRLLWALDRIASASGRSPRSISAAEMMALAERRTKLWDFGDDSFQAPLNVLARSYDEEADLSIFGRMAARWDAVRLLSNLLTLRSAERRSPAILAQKIEKPIFITGLPRSGTTFLHNLLSLDSSNLVVRCWETIYPCPLRTDPRADVRLRRRKVDRHLRQFAMLAPELRRMYPISADAPQECTEITAHVFCSLRFDTTHRVPSYQRWLDQVGHLAAYRFHRRFLSHLQHDRGPGRWILKCPDHVFALNAIHDTYPDARFVFMHRDPLEVLPSVAKLTEVLRRPFTRHIDRFEIGRQVSDRWAQGAAILVDAAANPRGSTNDTAHLKFRALVQDPVGTVAALYERFGMSFTEELAKRLREAVARWPQAEGHRHKIQLEEYGLDAKAERQLYRDYLACFGF